MSSSTLSGARHPHAPVPAPAAPAEPAPRETDWRIVLLGVLVVSAAYVLWHLGRGWVAHDDGALGQSAARVLQGELPHRDFDEIYTGGLAYLNAAAFRLLGTTLWTMRLVLFAAFIVWVPAVFYVASRFVKPVAAAGVTLLAVTWTLPNYPAPLPSWYNLFLATLGVAALFRHLETGGRRWLVVAGLLGGLSCLVKVIGLYYVAGVLLFLVFRAHALSLDARAADGTPARRGAGYALFVTCALALFVAALGLLVRRQLHLSEIVQFVMPGSMIAALLVRNEWVHPAGDSGARFAALVRLLLPFGLGLALPIVIFLVPYLTTGAVPALVNGLFVLPTKRFSFASMRAMPVWWMLTLVPVALLVGLSARRRAESWWHDAVLTAIAIPLLILVVGRNAIAYRVVWLAAFSLTPVLVAISVVLMGRERQAHLREPLLRHRTMLLLSVVAVCSLVQFPFSVPIYYCYVAPLAALLAVALYRHLPPVGSVPTVAAGLLLFFIAFAVFRTNTSEMTTFGNAYVPYGPVAPLLREHGGLDVQAADAEMYNRVVAQLHQRARGGYTWASPDAPEIYFLSGLRNPTRSLFEFFEDSATGDARVLRALDAHGVTAIVLNSQPSFSRPIAPRMFVQLATRYPSARNIGIFQLRWRE